MISDRNSSITVEPLADGLRVYDNPVETLTNNPPFDYQVKKSVQLPESHGLRPENRFCTQLNLTPYSKGMGPWGCLGTCLPPPGSCGLPSPG